ncbi:PREDICTED: uncharacterized protein LOC109340726 [Lupinus angustifolius]|uniref:uncharacterized protein LOC109340726 n=1 Tax=Lupinus angustifolius TaxID=3871 RepID=UPI00092F4292|nr:PREDICTED: uncharacterized protein LOC109340726 [Lupinus angustifolius]
MDGVVIANEIIDQARKNKNEECFIFKVDFEKAYDSVNWSFLLYMMERMGFCVKWRNWIKSCLQSNSVSILVNGSPTSEFNMVRGLRQGDPIAPFLFLIVVEGLAGIMRSAVAKRLFKGYEVGKDKVLISHLQYADDTLLIGAKSAENIMVLKSILKCFELVSGLRINFHKSQFIGINSDEDFVQMAVHKLFCCVGSVPFKFLGILVGANPMRIATWSPVIESFKKRLSSWQHNLISFGGRVTLIKLVFNSLSIYFFSFFKAPVAVILELEKIQRRFLWGRGEDRRGVHWVSWSKVCRSKGEGGLGVKNLSLFNLSLLGKWRWRLLFECDALWVRVLRSRYVARMGGSGGFSNPECFKRGSPWWRDLGCLGNRLFGVHNGWFQRLFQIALDKDACISSLGEWRDGSWLWSLIWRRRLFDWEKRDEEDLLNCLKDVKPVTDAEDGWLWIHAKDGAYSVQNAYLVLLNEVTNPDNIFFKRLWLCNVPPKLRCLAWRVSKDGVPTLLNLASRGVLGEHDPVRCIFCGVEVESVDHLFYSCSWSYGVWQKVYEWFGFCSVFPIGVKCHFNSHWNFLRLDKRHHHLWMSFWFVCIWCIWVARNKFIFEKTSLNLEEAHDILSDNLGDSSCQYK